MQSKMSCYDNLQLPICVSLILFKKEPLLTKYRLLTGERGML